MGRAYDELNLDSEKPLVQTGADTSNHLSF